MGHPKKLNEDSRSSYEIKNNDSWSNFTIENIIFQTTILDWFWENRTIDPKSSGELNLDMKSFKFFLNNEEKLNANLKRNFADKN